MMNTWIQVTAAIIFDEQRVLITQRARHDTMGGKWEFPGGKVEPGETLEACLQRELHEELGIHAEIHELYAVNRHAYPDITIELCAYRATIRSGQITLHTHHAFCWAPLHELGNFDFSDADKPIVRKLQTEAACSVSL